MLSKMVTCFSLSESLLRYWKEEKKFKANINRSWFGNMSRSVDYSNTIVFPKAVEGNAEY